MEVPAWKKNLGRLKLKLPILAAAATGAGPFAEKKEGNTPFTLAEEDQLGMALNIVGHVTKEGFPSCAVAVLETVLAVSTVEPELEGQRDCPLVYPPLIGALSTAFNSIGEADADGLLEMLNSFLSDKGVTLLEWMMFSLGTIKDGEIWSGLTRAASEEFYEMLWMFTSPEP